LLDEVDHADIAEIAATEIESQIVPQHLAETFQRRLVETELLFQIGDELRVQPLRAAIFGIDRAAVDSALPEIAATARKAVESVAALSGKLRDHPLDRTAGGELNDGEGNGHDAENRRDH